ncbi:MAG: hypothetical protein M3N68_10600 [Actinomycetota bacterium]|nr:hypothetical protein [Actinomycetota bacterium]
MGALIVIPAYNQEAALSAVLEAQQRRPRRTSTGLELDSPNSANGGRS